MTNNVDEVRSTLNDLVEMCKDSEEGYRAAAGHVKDHEIHTLFLEYSLQCAQFAGQLQEEVVVLGGEPATTGSVSGAIHRGWVGLKSALTVDNDLAVLEEAERAEDATIEGYHHALAKGLPANLRSIVEQQLSEIRKIHSNVRSLRDGHWKKEVPLAGLV